MDIEEDQKPMYPLDAKSYTIVEEIGRGMSSIIYRAFCDQRNTHVVIKSINVDKSLTDFDSIISMPDLHHQNISNSHCIFVAADNEVWVVMPLMSFGSLQSIMSCSFPTGLPESYIKIFLKQILNLLSYLHSKNIIQVDLKAGNIFLDLKGSIKFSDFNLWSSSLRMQNINGNSYWISPEVVKSNDGFSEKSDIWSFGILALELARGGPPLYDIPQSKSLRKKINERFCFGNYYADNSSDSSKTFSREFKNLVRKCLNLDPAKRPTLRKLQKHRFFTECKSADFIVDNMLKDLPSIVERFERSKERMVQEEEEEEEEDEKTHWDNTISGWNLNVDVLKLFPFYSSESNENREDKRVKFGGVTIIEDITAMEEDQDEEEEEEEEEEEDEDYYESDQLGAVCSSLTEVIERLDEVSGWSASREEFMGTLVTAKLTLEEQLERIIQVITLNGGLLPEQKNEKVLSLF